MHRSMVVLHGWELGLGAFSSLTRTLRDYPNSFPPRPLRMHKSMVVLHGRELGRGAFSSLTRTFIEPHPFQLPRILHIGTSLQGPHINGVDRVVRKQPNDGFKQRCDRSINPIHASPRPHHMSSA